MGAGARSVVVATIVLAFGVPGFAQRPAMPDPAKGYTWEAAAKRSGLTAEDIQQLSRDKVLITQRAFKQVFCAYLGGGLPYFLTSDSLLNAYHVLYEESVVRLEGANARKIAGVLEGIWKNIDAAADAARGNPELASAARLRAKVVIGTALALLDDRTIKPDADVAKLIAEEVKRIEAAQETFKPKWLGPPDAGFVALDYSRYKPRGFYTRSATLQRYFRAVSWLQSIPFRVSKDEELVSMAVLGVATAKAAGADLGVVNGPWGIFRAFSRFIGQTDDWDVETAAREFEEKDLLDLGGDALKKLRRRLIAKAARPGEDVVINDQVAFPPEDPAKVQPLGFRVLSGYRTPDAILFQRTTDPRVFPDRVFPDGLEVCAALGSTWAGGKLPGARRDEALKVIDASRNVFSGNSLYFRYFDCLRALVDECEPDAPAFMKTDPWQVKSGQTVLSGWAQLRHTWALQAKQTFMIMGATMQPAGFVEPEPEFFARMAALAADTRDALRDAGAFGTDTAGLAEKARAAAEFIKRKDLAHAPREKIEKDGLSMAEWELMDVAEALASCLVKDVDRDDRAAYYGQAVEKLAKLAEELDKGRMPEDERLAQVLTGAELNIDELWKDLEGLSRRLETLAHKQLRGVAFSEEENRFIKRYGDTLPHIMLYGGTSYEDPRDDAPRVVDVFTNPNVKKCLEVGIGRPREICVLYPTKSGEILCRGAVMPYYEFPSAARLTDAEWITLLGSKDRPDMPEWVRPIVSPRAINAPGQVEPE